MIWLERKLRCLCKELLIQYPAGAEEVSFVEIERIEVFDDAADLDIGHDENFLSPLDASSAYQRLLQHLPAEIHKRTVGPYGARRNSGDRACPGVKRNFDVSIPAACLGKDFDSEVAFFVSAGDCGRFFACQPKAATVCNSIVVAVDFMVKNDRRSARCKGFARHFQFICRDRLKMNTAVGRHREEQDKQGWPTNRRRTPTQGHYEPP